MDLNVNNQDYREIGMGRVVVNDTSVDQHHHDKFEDYCRSFFFCLTFVAQSLNFWIKYLFNILMC